MKLSMITDILSDHAALGLSVADKMKLIRSCGFTCVDYSIEPDMLGDDWKEQAQTAKAAMAEAGVVPMQGHAPCVNPLLPGEIDLLPWAERVLAFSKEAGIPQVVIHPGAVDGNTREEFFEANVAFYKSVLPIAERYGVVVLTENIGNYADPYYLWNGADLRELIDRVDHPMLKACWDVGHANHFFPEHCNQYDSLVALGDKLAALHVHDNIGDMADPRQHHRIDMHTLPYASHVTSVNYDAVMQGLKDAGYTGTFNFESAVGGRTNRQPFFYKGEEVKKLALPSLEYWKLLYTAAYTIGKYMLETYELTAE